VMLAGRGADARGLHAAADAGVRTEALVHAPGPDRNALVRSGSASAVALRLQSRHSVAEPSPEPETPPHPAAQCVPAAGAGGRAAAAPPCPPERPAGAAYEATGPPAPGS